MMTREKLKPIRTPEELNKALLERQGGAIMSVQGVIELLKTFPKDDGVLIELLDRTGINPSGIIKYDGKDKIVYFTTRIFEEKGVSPDVCDCPYCQSE